MDQFNAQDSEQFFLLTLTSAQTIMGDVSTFAETPLDRIIANADPVIRSMDDLIAKKVSYFFSVLWKICRNTRIGFKTIR